MGAEGGSRYIQLPSGGTRRSDWSQYQGTDQTDASVGLIVTKSFSTPPVACTSFQKERMAIVTFPKGAYSGLQDSFVDVQLHAPSCVQSNSICLELGHGNVSVVYTHSREDPWESWDGNSHVCGVTGCWTCKNSSVSVQRHFKVQVPLGSEEGPAFSVKRGSFTWCTDHS